MAIETSSPRARMPPPLSIMAGTSFLRKLSPDRHQQKKKPRGPTAQTRQETVDDSIDSQDGMLKEDGERSVFSYRLTCSACNSGKYYVNQTEEKVGDTLMDHYEDLWAIIEDARGGLACWDMNGVNRWRIRQVRSSATLDDAHPVR